MIPLVAHASAPPVPARRVAASARRGRDGTLTVVFRVAGALRKLRVPAPRPPRIVQGLWRHTCFEAFVALDGTAAYHEVNLSPSGAWAVHGFRGYRDGGPLADPALAPRIDVVRAPDALTLTAVVPLARLSAAYARAPLRLGLAAVLESADGARTYWALRHPPGRPDFHHPDAFAWRLEAPGGSCEGGTS